MIFCGDILIISKQLHHLNFLDDVVMHRECVAAVYAALGFLGEVCSPMQWLVFHGLLAFGTS